MSTSVRSIPAAATGAVFAVVLTLANGQGGTLSAPRDIAATVALTLLLPFTAYVGAVLRAASTCATDTWLATTAVAGGVAGTCIKLLSDAPQIAQSDPGVTSGSQTDTALAAVAAATTVLALFPLALFCLAAGVAALRTMALPRWLALGALVAGGGLAVNGCFLHTENVPALLLLAVWCLAASVHLVRAARRDPVSTFSATPASA
jgi:hypothetical protein